MSMPLNHKLALRFRRTDGLKENNLVLPLLKSLQSTPGKLTRICQNGHRLEEQLSSQTRRHHFNQ